jgi:ATPase subunit of ABC transporter with duplicated ATPase domains
MDVETRVSLSDLLNQFVGAVLVVSHDEDFCAAFAPTQIWNLTKYGIRHEFV